jgi:hypothetical protein
MERAKTPKAVFIIRAGWVDFGQKYAGGTLLWTPGEDGAFVRLPKSCAGTSPLMHEGMRIQSQGAPMVKTMDGLPS